MSMSKRQGISKTRCPFLWVYFIDIDENRRKEDILVEKGSFIHLWERPFVLEASTDYDKDFELCTVFSKCI